MRNIPITSSHPYNLQEIKPPSPISQIQTGAGQPEAQVALHTVGQRRVGKARRGQPEQPTKGTGL